MCKETLQKCWVSLLFYNSRDSHNFLIDNQVRLSARELCLRVQEKMCKFGFNYGFKEGQNTDCR